MTLDWEGALEPWVERNVMPYLDTVPDSLVSPRMNRARCRARRSRTICRAIDAPLIVADWPEDIAQFFNALLITGPGTMVEVPPLDFRLQPLSGFQHRRQQQGAAQCAARCAGACEIMCLSA